MMWMFVVMLEMLIVLNSVLLVDIWRLIWKFFRNDVLNLSGMFCRLFMVGMKVERNVFVLKLLKVSVFDMNGGEFCFV